MGGFERLSSTSNSERRWQARCALPVASQKRQISFASAHTGKQCGPSNEHSGSVTSFVMKVPQTRTPQKQVMSDGACGEIVKLEIGQHPELNANQKTLIELDYGIKNGAVTIPIIKTLLYFGLKRLGIEAE